MEQLMKNIPLPSLGFTPKYQGDLLVHEGPLLSHVVNEENNKEHYFYKWTDCNDTLNRWLIFKVSERDLIIFFEKKINLLQLILKNPFVYFLDVDDNIQPIHTSISQTTNIPSDYLPSKNSFFDIDEYESYATKLFQKIKQQQQEEYILEQILEEISELKQHQLEQDKFLNIVLEKLAVV